jgi:hypothetical protein
VWCGLQLWRCWEVEYNPPSEAEFAAAVAKDMAGEEAFQFLLATAMHEAGKFELVSVVEMDGQRH